MFSFYEPQVVIAQSYTPKIPQVLRQTYDFVNVETAQNWFLTKSYFFRQSRV